MKKIKTNNIVENVRRQPFNKASLEHIQEAFQEVFTNMLKGITEEASGVVVLWGCVDSDPDATDFNISAGAVLYNGEVFDVPAFVGSHATNVPVLSLVTAYRAGDPVKFSDNNDFDVHEVRTMVWALGVSGSGIVDFGSVKRLRDTFAPSRTYYNGKTYRRKVIDIGDWNMDTTPTKLVPHGLPDQMKIREIQVMIQNDSGTLIQPLNSVDITGLKGSIQSIGSDINLMRYDSPATFDSTAYDLTPFNRGWISIIYEE